MRKFSILILAILLIAIVFSFTSCQADAPDNFVDEVAFSVLGEDSAFAQQIADFEFFMQTKSFAKKLGDTLTEIEATIASIDFGDVKSIIGAVGAIIANYAAWLVAVVVYGFCILYMLFYDLMWMLILAFAFIILLIIYGFNSLLVLFFGLFV